MNTAVNEEDLQWKTSSNIEAEGTEHKLNIASYEDDHRGNSEEIQEEISSVALLSPACMIYFYANTYQFKWRYVSLLFINNLLIINVKKMCNIVW